MSDEERARYLQHRADMEEEARRRKRELIARFIKNKLDKEEAYSRMNRAKINQEWRYILRRIKCKQMEADIQVGHLLRLPNQISLMYLNFVRNFE
ncbi:unnamed protein product [Chilo suppressalis]|uniref:Dynein regulatory complex subunit 2 n=1 Tax=Chilo suppressalis TaxID=168631 RepID=A0ABN8AW61_CHISP|nr:unnamed protein product [Chilo suppressalis]